MSNLSDLLATLHQKETLITFMNEHPGSFEEALALAETDEQPQCWRACWMLFHTMVDNDERIQPKISRLIEVLPDKEDGHKRELIKILSRMELDDDQEGKLFDICMTIWESVKKIPSVRMMAFRLIVKVISKYPELKSELTYMMEPQYTDSLSPGIRNSVVRQFDSIIKP